jgi:tetratricopeptide (TPR) repeat protein
MRSCIILFYIWVFAHPSGAQSPDALYADRANLASARAAASAWAVRSMEDPADFDAAWKLARAAYWLGGHAPETERRAFLEDGIEAGRRAAALQPMRAEGHFWVAANMGALAESFGIRQGLKYRKAIKEQLQTVLRLDPGFQDGSADRALGRWYFKVPRLFGGNHTRAEEHLRRSLAYDPHSTVTRFFLAELLIDDDRLDEARAELQAVIDAPPNPGWIPEDQDYKARARARLATLK